MKLLITLLLSFIFFGAHNVIWAQDTILVKNNYIVPVVAEADTIKVLMPKLEKDTTQVLLIYNKEFKLLKQYSYKTYKETKKEMHGSQIHYFNDGGIKAQWAEINGKKEGIYESFWNNGILKRLEVYKNDVMISGKLYNDQGVEIAYIPLEIKAKIEGGDDAMSKYIRKNLRYPDKAKMNEIDGVVIASFIVEEDGSITNVRIASKTLHSSLDEEVIRVISAMPKWIPAVYDGQVIRSIVRYPITFSLSR